MAKQVKKPKVGFYGVTGCAGCLLSVIFNEDEIVDIINSVDIVSFPFIKGQNSDGELDICFIEGTVVSKDDEKVVNQLRERSKVIVALGTCACEGNIPAIRNYTDKNKLSEWKFKKNPQNQDTAEAKPVHEVIQVEYRLPGCPPDRDEVKRFIKDLLLNKVFRNFKSAVCIECKLNENGCLLDDNQICLGPITSGGCNAVCPSHGLKCYGCRGIADDANFDEYFEMLKSKNIKPSQVMKIMDTFMARAVVEKLKGTKWEKYR
jgi:sulfhydrogenase subunit delta